MQRKYPFFKIGIIGGGQLAKMMTQEAKKMGFWVGVLDPTPSSPAGQLADRQIVADFYDSKALKTLVEESDVATYDIEHVNTQALKEESLRRKVFPSPEVLEIIQDKLRQKETLSRGGIPVPSFLPEVSHKALRELGSPTIWKARFGGYDGKGVAKIEKAEDLASLPQKEAFLEELVTIEKELAVIVARSRSGETVAYPVVEMVFHAANHICDQVFAPARISEETAQKAQEIAQKCVTLLQGVGVFAVEMFLDQSGKLLVNEIAPRPHNSGHFTIEACVTSQFEQHLRAICGLPLGSTQLLAPAVMVNLLGEKGAEGVPVVEGLEEAMAIKGVSFHFYGKAQVRPFRKMGHVTIVDTDLEAAIRKAQRIKEILHIRS